LKEEIEEALIIDLDENDEDTKMALEL